MNETTDKQSTLDRIVGEIVTGKLTADYIVKTSKGFNTDHNDDRSELRAYFQVDLGDHYVLFNPYQLAGYEPDIEVLVWDEHSADGSDNRSHTLSGPRSRKLAKDLLDYADKNPITIR